MEDDLSAVREQPSPREEELVNRLARKLVPSFQFIFWGFLYGIVALSLSTLLTMSGLVLLPPALVHPMTNARIGMFVLVGLAIFALSWFPFAAWVDRRRGGMQQLIRDGELIECQISLVQRLTLNRAPIIYVSLKFENQGVSGSGHFAVANPQSEFAVGQSLPLLVATRSPHAATFVEGNAIAVKLKQVSSSAFDPVSS